MSVLIDTNIIIDALQNRERFANYSELVVLQAYEYDGYISATSVTDIYYIQRRYYHDKEKARKNLEKVLKLYGIIDVTEIDSRNALRSDISDFEDAVLVESAKRNSIDCIVTRNTKDFKNTGIKVYTPIEFLEQMRE